MCKVLAVMIEVIIILDDEKVANCHPGESLAVLCRVFSTLEGVQHCGRISSVLWGDKSVHWRMFSIVVDTIRSTVDGHSKVLMVSPSTKHLPMY